MVGKVLSQQVILSFSNGLTQIHLSDAGATRPQQRSKIMVALEMPREFVSHPVMKQVSECLVKIISRYLECNC